MPDDMAKACFVKTQYNKVYTITEEVRTSANIKNTLTLPSNNRPVGR